ncbi:uncharacterized protein PgNI_01872 [Pyricularia grisea]|uniref:Uncharacterized protein n=1 Tax=Pyricularia grisea TaxID=148305 RepID=A0A6P8BIH0_PYRGI|nr:uncharacterized protein PgNI_01872 [Pyricularia grisea]TLD16417.1 hypothetical protein PgNI_01872 [Pyricularia grisea]
MTRVRIVTWSNGIHRLVAKGPLGSDGGVSSGRWLSEQCFFLVHPHISKQTTPIMDWQTLATRSSCPACLFTASGRKKKTLCC